MTQLDSVLQELEQTDRSLISVPLGDFGPLEAILHTRGILLNKAALAIDTLQQPAPEHRAALMRSRQAASQALRQLILARHMLVAEMSQLQQDKRLGDALRAQSSPPAHRLSLQG